MVNSFTQLFGKHVSVLRDRNYQVVLLATVNTTLGVVLVLPLLDSLAGPFGVPKTTVGFVLTAFTAPTVVMIPLSGLLTDRFSRKPVLLAGLAFYGIAGAAVSLTTEFRLILALRFLQGIGWAGVTPVLITIIGDMYTGSEEAAAQGFRLAVASVAAAVVPLAAAGLAAVDWRYAFLLHGMAVTIAAVVLLRFEEPAKRTTDWARRDYVPDLRALVTQRTVLALVTARAVPPFMYITFMTYNSIVLRLLGGSAGAAGLVVAVASLTNAVGATQTGRITDAFDSRRNPIVVAHLTMGVGVAELAHAMSVGAGVVASIVLSLGFGLLISLYRSILTGVASESLRGSIVSIGESTDRLAATVAPLVVGVTVTVVEPVTGFGVAVRMTLTAVAVGGT